MKKTMLMTSAVTIMLLSQVSMAHAGPWDHRDHRYVHRVPVREQFVVQSQYVSYYTPPTYVAVPAIGSIVYAIPAGCHQYIVNGVTYYEQAGIYYLPVVGGYQVVNPPVIVQQPIIVQQAPVFVEEPAPVVMERTAYQPISKALPGAALGGVLGGITGGVIGYQQKGHNEVRGALLGTAVGAALGGILGAQIPN